MIRFARRRAAGLRPRADDAAVSDVVGSVLMVGITVVVAGGLALLIASHTGPVDRTHADLVLTVADGDGVWGNGNERVNLTHRGGEALRAPATTITVRVGAASIPFSGTGLGSAFSDDRFTLGETWSATLSVPQGSAVSVSVSVEGKQGTSLVPVSPITAGVAALLPRPSRRGTAAPGHRGFGEDRQGIASVVGAVLVTAILVSLLVTVRLRYVPVWEEDAEASHSVAIQAQLSELKSGLDRMAGNGTPFAFSQPVRLGEAKASTFAEPPVPDRLEFTPGGRNFTLATSRLLVVSVNGTSTAGLNPAWRAIPGNDTLTNMTGVESFRLRVDLINKALVGKSVNVSVVDANNAPAGSLLFRIEQTQPDLVLMVRVRDPTGAIIAEDFEAFHQNDEFNPYYVDLLDDEYLFDQLLAAAPSPFGVALTQDGLTASYAITYASVAADGTPVQIGSVGVLRAPYNSTAAGGVLHYAAFARHYVGQDYYLEHGALILQQADGAVFKVPPVFTASRAGNTTSVAVNLHALTGASASAQGDAAATIGATPLTVSRTVGSAPHLNLTVDTAFPALWGTLWTDALTRAGLTSAGAAPQFAVTTGAGVARLTIWGTTADPASTVHDLSLVLDQSQIQTTLQV